MALSERWNEILRRWEDAGILRRRDPVLPVWGLGWPGLFARQRRKAVAACRRELLTTLLGSGGPVFLVHGESPEQNGIPGNWQPAGKATWLVPPDFNLDHPDVGYWLFHLGDWKFYRAPAPAEKSVDAFRCSASELLAWMRARSVEVLIDSFHDDTDWVVALGTPEPTATPDRGSSV
jgi:hypothetical protein